MAIPRFIQLVPRICYVFFMYVLRRLWKVVAPGHAVPPAKRTNWALEGPFAPIHQELFVEDLEIIGELPADIDGEYVRNGPNPRFKEDPAKYHWFEGDGMLHGVRLRDGRASYVNKWVRTERYQSEQFSGKKMYDNFATMESLPGLVKIIVKKAFEGPRPSPNAGTGNTALEYHDGRLLALNEGDFPHHIHLPRLETVGLHTFDDKLKNSFTAHPKVDCKTGEMMTFGYRMDQRPYVNYSVVDAKGTMLRTVGIDIEVPVMMHDFAVTENYTIFPEFPFTFRFERLLVGESLFKFESDRPARFGILPRHCIDANAPGVRWFESPSCYVFHFANAWEEGDDVVLMGCRSETTSAIGLNDERKPGANEKPILHQWRFNMKTGKVVERQMMDIYCEFPRVDDLLVGYPARYAYAAQLTAGTEPSFVSALKIDLLSASAADTKPLSYQSVPFGPGRIGGELCFIKRKNAASEDDGYLTTFVFDEATQTSELWIIDALTMAQEPVCRVKLPQRVPIGFHGKWVSGEQIRSQRKPFFSETD